MRHEKGIGHELPRYAADRAVRLMAEITGARVASGIVDNDPEPAPARVIEVELARLERLLGILVAAEEVVACCARWASKSPATGRWRRRCRIIGLTWWPRRTWPRKRPRARLRPDSPAACPRRRCRRTGRTLRAEASGQRILGGLGLDEVVLHALIGADDLARSGYDDADPDLIRLANPLAEQHSIMRPVPYLSMLAALAENVRQRRTDPWLFEVGKTYWMGGSRGRPG